MAKPNGRGGWDLTDEDVAEIMAVNWPDEPDPSSRSDASVSEPTNALVEPVPSASGETP